MCCILVNALIALNWDLYRVWYDIDNTEVTTDSENCLASSLAATQSQFLRPSLLSCYFFQLGLRNVVQWS